MKSKIYQHRILIGFGAVISLFYLIFTKLVLKSDDGHFLGIINDEGFNTFDWLRMRYETISGRTFCELLTVFFLSKHIILWKIFSSFMWIVFMMILFKFLSAFGADEKTKKFACCIPFLIFLGCLNSSVFWVSGSFTYFIPFAFSVISFAPLVFDVYEIDYKRAAFIVFSSLCAPFACSEEQSSAITVSVMCICIVYLAAKKRLKFFHFIPLVFAAAETFFLFTSPGMKGRGLMEAEDFPRFLSLSLPEKIACGLSNFYAFEFMMSLIVFGLFSWLLYLSVRNISKKISAVYMISCISVCVAANLVYIITMHKLPDKGFERAFLSGSFSAGDIALFALGCVLLIEVCVMLFLLFRSDKKTGTAAAVCFAAAVFSSAVLGFSSSIYISGQRVFFFSDIFILIAACVMFSSLKSEKSKQSVLNTAQAAALIFLFVNCFSFSFMETPVMG